MKLTFWNFQRTALSADSFYPDALTDIWMTKGSSELGDMKDSVAALRGVMLQSFTKSISWEEPSALFVLACTTLCRSRFLVAKLAYFKPLSLGLAQ